jgi:hypothetical protein
MSDISNWVREAVETMNQRPLEARNDFGPQIRDDYVALTKARHVFKMLSCLVEEAVNEFNAANSIQGRRMEFHNIPSNRMLIRRPQYPSLQMEVWLDVESRSVRFTTATRIDREHPLRQTVGRLRTRLVADELQISNGERLLDLEKACKLLLSPFFT